MDKVSRRSMKGVGTGAARASKARACVNLLCCVTLCTLSFVYSGKTERALKPLILLRRQKPCRQRIALVQTESHLMSGASTKQRCCRLLSEQELDTPRGQLIRCDLRGKEEWREV